ncbi:MAG: Leu/Phe/Val dehydrogenase [Sphingomonadaceae bacterium]
MTGLWNLPDFDDHEGVHLFHDARSGLAAIVAIHSTALGPAAGGTRFWSYAAADDAVTDALRLSRGMSYKNAMAGLPAGGGKAVILAPPGGAKSEAMLTAFARCVDSLGGRYITAQDVGMSEADMVALSATTRHVAGLPGLGGDPGPSTARGVYLGICAAARRALARASMHGVHVAIQGVGSVGGGVARALAQDGARLTIADTDAGRANALAGELGAKVVAVEAIMSVEADIFSPCALGAILTADSIAGLRVAAVAGGANNQLATPHDGDALLARGILYAPDYVINAGGIVNVLRHLDGSDDTAIIARVAEIPGRLEAIWDDSAATGEAPARVADRMARALIGR